MKTVIAPFGAWLRAQAKRQDPVGDLARDLKAERSRAVSPSGVVRHLNRSGATYPAFRAYERALHEWRTAQKVPVPDPDPDIEPTLEGLTA